MSDRLSAMLLAVSPDRVTSQSLLNFYECLLVNLPLEATSPGHPPNVIGLQAATFNTMADSLRDSGRGITRLIGQVNYNRWARGFRLLAKSKYVWFYFTTEHDNRYGGSNRFDANGQLYRVPHSVGRRQAMQLLLFSVDTALRGELEQFLQVPSHFPPNSMEEGYPYEAWKYLQEKYQMSSALATELATIKMDGLYLPDFNNVTEYLKEFQLLSQDIVDAGGILEEKEVVKKIVAGLSLEYETFSNANTIVIDPLQLDLKALTAGLLLFEAALKRSYRQRRKLEAMQAALKCREAYDSDETEDDPELLNTP